MPEFPSGGLTVQNVSFVSCRSMTVLALNTSVFDFRGGASVEIVCMVERLNI
jgi:hypothetical protein